jgi:hypothetical protein
MTILSQIRNGEPQRHRNDRAATVEALLSAHREAEYALRQSIRAEEERTCLHNLNDPCYSTLAHSMRARAGNLKRTITMLEAARYVCVNRGFPWNVEQSRERKSMRRPAFYRPNAAN